MSGYQTAVRTLDELRATLSPPELRVADAFGRALRLETLCDVEAMLRRAQHAGRIYGHHVDRQRGRVVIWPSNSEHSRVVVHFDQEQP